MSRRSPFPAFLSLATAVSLLATMLVVGAPVVSASAATDTGGVETTDGFTFSVEAQPRLFPGERATVTVRDTRPDSSTAVTTDYLLIEPAPIGKLSVIPGTVKRVDGTSGSVTAAIGTRGELEITFSNEGVTTDGQDVLIVFEVEPGKDATLADYPLTLTVTTSQDGGATTSEPVTHIFGTGTESIAISDGPVAPFTDEVATYTVSDAREPDTGPAITDRLTVALPAGWQLVGQGGAADGTFELGGVTTEPGQTIARFSVIVPSDAPATSYAGSIQVTTDGGGTLASQSFDVAAVPSLSLTVEPAVPVTGGAATITVTTATPLEAVTNVDVVLPEAWSHGDQVGTVSFTFDPPVDVAADGTVLSFDARAGASGTIEAGVGDRPRVARTWVDVDQAYAIAFDLPAAVVPGQGFTLVVVDDRPLGLGATAVTEATITLPASILYDGTDATSTTTGDDGSTTLTFDLTGTTTSPAETTFQLDLEVDAAAAAADVSIPVTVTPLDGAAGAGAAVTRIAAGPPEVELFGAVRLAESEASTSVGVVGLLKGTPSAFYAISIEGFSDAAFSGGCLADGAALGTLLLQTDPAGLARFGAVGDVPTGSDGAVRVVSARELVAAADDTFAVGEEYLAPAYLGSDCLPAGFGNDSWPTAYEVEPTSTTTDRITVSGSDRWYRFPVAPGSQVTIDLTGLPADYDLVAFTDIEEAFVSASLGDPVAALDRAGAQSAPSAFSPSAFSPSAFSPSAFSPSAFSPSAFSPSAFSPSVYAPSAFSPSAFSPSAFSPSAFSPSAFSPSAFSPDAYSPSAFSPSAFSPSAFSPSAFSPSAFSPSAFSGADAFSPSAFSPSAFSPSAFSAAQTQTVINMSATRGLADERLVVNTWDNDTYFYVRVSGAGGAFDPAATFDLTVTSVTSPACEGVAPIEGGPAAATVAGKSTLILWDSAVTGPALDAKLSELATATDGVVVDLAGDTWIGQLRDQAEREDPALGGVGCVYATNLLAAGIKEVVDLHRVANPLEYVVLVGGDDAIPFFRYPDEGLLGPESDYEPPVDDGTISQTALRENQVLGQDEYGAKVVLEYGGTRMPIPDLAVGRLVETPMEIAEVIDAYLDPNDDGVIGIDEAPHVIQPQSTLVTGYDFLADAALGVQQEFVDGTTDNGEAARNELLLPLYNLDGSIRDGEDLDGDGTPDRDPGAIAPSDLEAGSWTADQLRDALFNPALKHDLVYLAGHFSANSALAADYETSLVTTELLGPDGPDLRGSLVFSGGCHSGYNIVDDHIVPGLTLNLDWAQVMARKGATLVAGTGYQYGDTDLVEYSERLYLQFARELRRGQVGEAQSVGEALVRAKLDYLQTTPEPRGLHHKSLLIATVFGLPMSGVDMPGRLPETPRTSEVSPQQTAGQPGTAGVDLGLHVDELAIDFTSANPLVKETVALQEVGLDGFPLLGGDGQPATHDATYYTGPDGTVLQPNEPILPLSTHDVSAAGLSLRGVAFRGGTYSDAPGVIPLSAAAATELRGVHVPFASEVFFPMRIATANYYGAVGQDEGARETLLHVTPVQHRAAFIGDVANYDVTRRVFDDLNLELFYSSTLEVETDNGTVEPGLSTAPRVVSVESELVDGGIEFRVRVLGDPAAGMHEVWVTYTESAGGTQWQSLDLAPVPSDSGLWTGVLPRTVDEPRDLDFIVQAINGVGLVGMDDNFGAFYRTGVAPASPDTPTAVVSLDVDGDLFYGGQATVTATLTLDDSQTAIVGARVLLGFGGTAVISAITNEDGVASATFPVTSPSGEVSVVASFVGTDELQPSSRTVTRTVAPADTVLTLTPDDAGGIDVSLNTVTGVPAGEQTVILTALADGQQLAVITSPGGTINVPASRFTAASGEVEATYAGSSVFGESSSAAVQRAPSPTTIDLTLPSGTVTYGDPVTITAIVENSVGAVPAGSPVTITVNGRSYPAETDAGGVASVDIVSIGTDDEDGRVQVVAIYAGDADNEPRSASATFFVAPKTTSIQLGGDTSVFVDEGATLTATVTAADAAAAGAVVVFEVAGAEVARETSAADGIVGYTLPTPTAGEVAVTATVVKTPEYASSTAAVDVVVSKRGTTLEWDSLPADVLAGDDASVTVTAKLESDGVPLVGQDVTFSINGVETETRVTVLGGFVDFTVPTPASGTVVVDASFAGTTKYLRSSAQTEITIGKRSTNLELWPVDQAFVDEGVTIRARLTNDGLVVVGETVVFTIGEKTFERTTDDSGFAEVPSTTSLTSESGTFTIGASFTATPVYAGSSSEGSFTVVKRPSSLTIGQPSPTPTLNGLNIGVSSELRDESGQLLDGTITFAIDDVVVATIDTVDGVAELGVVEGLDLALGEYTLTATYAGDGRVYLPDEAQTALVIGPLTSLGDVLLALLGIVDDVASPQDQDKVQQAIGHVEDALPEYRWSGGRAADTQVLTAIRKAVIALEKVRDKDPVVMSVVNESVQTLVDVADFITWEAIVVATESGADPAALAKANEEYEKGLVYLARGQYDNAIGRWELAFAALLA